MIDTANGTVADLNSPNFGRLLSAGPARLLQFGVKLLF